MSKAFKKNFSILTFPVDHARFCTDGLDDALIHPSGGAINQEHATPAETALLG